MKNVNEMNETMVAPVEESTALITPEDLEEVKAERTSLTVSDLTNPAQSAMYCSITDFENVDSKIAVYNAMNNPDEKLADHVNNVIEVKDILAHEIELADEDTGELIRTLRTVLIDTTGKTYVAVSGGVANSVQRILQIFGQPGPWENPVKVKPRRVATRNGNNMVTILDIVK